MEGQMRATAPDVDMKKKKAIWAIGIYEGATPFDLKPVSNIQNPVIAARDVSDVRAEFVADPFMIKDGDTWHMFFEVMNADTNKGDIGLATSADGLSWSYRQIVLTEPFHLSYPDVFFLNGEHYMIPESYEAGSIKLYRADPFPLKWTPVKELIEGRWVDPSIFFFQGRWWMYASPLDPENEMLYLFYADSIEGPWNAHSMNPIIEKNNRIARPGGRAMVNEEKVIRFTQDCHPYYGTMVRAFEISELTPSSYAEREVDQSPVLSPGDEWWRSAGMHHVDPHFVNGEWLACVDGWRLEDRKPQTGGSNE